MVEEETLFIPSSDIERRYKEQVKNLLEYNGSKSKIINMGRLPEVYTALGIKDKELKTNGKTILKSLGIEGKNKHNVSKETIENLLSLTYDPEAVFKSLSTSDNPDSYVAVLNAKAFNQKQIIAILSPSRNGQGFTFIPSVYERNKFEQFINQTYFENRILYIKNEGSRLWGKLQSLPRHNQEPSTKNIFTKNDIVKHFKEKNMAIGHSELPGTENMVYIAEIIVKLGSHLDPNVQPDFKTALSCVELYKKTFGEEGYVYLEKRTDSLITKYGYETPDQIGLQEIKKLLDRIESPYFYKYFHSEDIKGYQNFIESEKKEINAFTSGSQKQGQIKEEMIKNGETLSLERQNINSKEKIMSDEFEEEEKKLTPEQLKGQNCAYQRNIVASALKAGTHACLPKADGYADTIPAVNIMTIDKPYHGANLLFLKEHQNRKENGFPTAEYITHQQIEKAQKDHPDLFIRQGQKGVSIHASEKNKLTGDYEDKHYRLFNVAQLNKPKLIKEWAANKREEYDKEHLEKLQTQYGTGYKLPEKKPQEPGPEIVCNSTEPEKYLGQYFSAVSMGSKFKVSPEQASEFSEKMLNALNEKWISKKTGEPVLGKEGQPVTNPYKLEDICRDANKYCKEFMRDLNISIQKQNQPEQKQEQTLSMGYGR